MPPELCSSSYPLTLGVLLKRTGLDLSSDDSFSSGKGTTTYAH